MSIAPAAELEAVPYSIRPMRPDELTFVASTWARSYLASPWARVIDSDEYFHGHSALITRILERGVALVAEHDVYKDLLLAHAVGERHALGPVLHYVYTKGDYRKRGIAHAVEHAVLERIRKGNELVRFTHKRAPGDAVAKRRGYRWSPYALYPQQEKQR